MKISPLNRTQTRQQRIVEMTRRDCLVSIDDLAREFGVTPQTIRRDINLLCDANILRRRHGGAEMFDAPRNADYDLRSATNARAKERIGHAVARMVEDGATVFISVGTTPAFVANALRHRRHLTVVSNNLNAALALSEEASNRIILPGGELRLPDRDMIGEAARGIFTRYRADIGIFGVAGIDADGALLDFHEAEVAVREAIRLNARQSILVADRTKFGRLAPIVGGSIQDVDRIVIDAPPASGFTELLQSVATRLHVAQEDA
jgi:DeoR family transcriptional regulator, glycerol-3-phosphate regulon repressor